MADDTAWLALLRGINVGGHRKVPMAELRELVTGLGRREVRTLIASGNVVFRGADDDEATVVAELEDAIAERFGFEVPVVVRRLPELEALLDDDPFPDAEQKLVHVHFLREPVPAAAAAALEAAAGEVVPEAAVVRPREIVVHYANGSARSAIGPILSRRLRADDPGTARNWNTVTKLVAMLRE